jgi:hypothetical protein
MHDTDTPEIRNVNDGKQAVLAVGKGGSGPRGKRVRGL